MYQIDPYAFAVTFCLYIAICGGVGAIIGSQKKSALGGFIAGALLGPIGWIITCFFDNRDKCPECAARHNDGAKKCPQCQYEFDKVEDPETPKTYEFPCNKCNQFMIYPSSAAGTKVVCEHCGALTVMPGKRPLITCEDCGKPVSSRATSCPSCGCPL